MDLGLIGLTFTSRQPYLIQSAEEWQTLVAAANDESERSLQTLHLEEPPSGVLTLPLIAHDQAIGGLAHYGSRIGAIIGGGQKHGAGGDSAQARKHRVHAQRYPPVATSLSQKDRTGVPEVCESSCSSNPSRRQSTPRFDVGTTGSPRKPVRCMTNRHMQGCRAGYAPGLHDHACPTRTVRSGPP